MSHGKCFLVMGVRHKTQQAKKKLDGVGGMGRREGEAGWGGGGGGGACRN